MAKSDSKKKVVDILNKIILKSPHTTPSAWHFWKIFLNGHCYDVAGSNWPSRWFEVTGSRTILNVICFGIRLIKNIAQFYYFLNIKMLYTVIVLS